MVTQQTLVQTGLFNPQSLTFLVPIIKVFCQLFQPCRAPPDTSKGNWSTIAV